MHRTSAQMQLETLSLLVFLIGLSVYLFNRFQEEKIQDQKAGPTVARRSAANHRVRLPHVEDVIVAFITFIVVEHVLYKRTRVPFPLGQCDKGNKIMGLPNVLFMTWLSCYIETASSGVFIFALVILSAFTVYTFKQRKLNQALQGQCDGLASARATQKAKIQELENELAMTKAKAADAAIDADAKDVANASKFSNLNVRFTKLQNVHEQFQTTYKLVQDELQARISELQSNHNQLQIIYKTVQDERQALRTERDELKKRVETQAAELAAASAHEITFMTEKVVASGVTSVMEELNNMISRIASRLISIIPANAEGSLYGEPLQADARAHAIEAISERLLDLVTTRSKDDHSMLAVALQSGLARACFLAITRVTGRVQESDVAYRQVWLNDKQGVVSRSRAPTNQRLSGLTDENAVVEVVLAMLASVLVSIGWNDEPQHIRSRLRRESEGLGDQIGRSADHICSTRGDIRRVVDETGRGECAAYRRGYSSARDSGARTCIAHSQWGTEASVGTNSGT
ncbi:hypothetical protein APHAL10511_003532 [Amanita phalloides]|nr:hypothetical protein APHAL10511_003532 [Amanita phalloides]